MIRWSVSANVASHLQPGGCFVIEVEVPQLQRLPPGETVRVSTVTPKHLGFDEFDLAVKVSYPTTTGSRREASEPYRCRFAMCGRPSWI